MELSVERLVELRDRVEVGVTFLQEWDLLPREKAAIKELSTVMLDIMRACGGMDPGILDSELSEQGLGDSKPNWELGFGYTGLNTGSEERIRSAVLRYRGDKLALDDIATETWSRIHFPGCKPAGGLCEEVLVIVFAEARGLLRSLSEQERSREPRIYDEWGEQWIGTGALIDLFLGPPGGGIERAPVTIPQVGTTSERMGTEALTLAGDWYVSKRHGVLDQASMSEGLFYRALVVNKLTKARDQDLENVRDEILLEGSGWDVTGGMGLLRSSPFSQLRSMYTVWDAVGAVMERRSELKSAVGHGTAADEQPLGSATPIRGAAGNGGDMRTR